MKRLDAVDLYRYANFQFPDDGDLALFNLIFEVMNGSLVFEVIEGPPDVVDAEDTDVAAAVGLATIGPDPCRINWVFDPDQEHLRPILLDLARRMAVEPQPKRLLDLARPPFTMAMLVACEGKDGRFAYALFRHPGIDQAQARMILAGLFPAEEDDGAPPTLSN